MITSKTTNNSTTKQKLEFPILVIDEDGCVFYVTRYTNGNGSPCVNFSEIGELPSLYTLVGFDLSEPFPQNGFDLFNGTITLTQETNK